MASPQKRFVTQRECDHGRRRHGNTGAAISDRREPFAVRSGIELPATPAEAMKKIGKRI
jgi:hypothetical protein